MHRENFSLDTRYRNSGGVVFLSGIQALVRLPMDQRRLDETNGLNTAGLISGYRGSPLGGLDKELWTRRADLDAHGIVFQPAVNEDLAATAVWGSQQVGLFQGAKYDGVFGMWYGKAPGLDRSCDAIRHANMAGSAENGGVLLVVGDDHGAKSSSMPNSSEFALMDMGIPVLNPADVQDVLDFGLFGWALSRYAGTWVSLIALADTMDSATTAEVGIDRHQFKVPTTRRDVHLRLDDAPLDQEARHVERKLALVRDFARVNGINRVVSDPARPLVTVVTTGKAYLDVRQAFSELGLMTEQDLSRAGVRLVKLGMTWPLDTSEINAFASQSERIVVVEEKRGFVEDQLKSILYGSGPAIVGKRDERGATLFPASGELSVAMIARVLNRYVPNVPSRTYLERLDTHATAIAPITDMSKTSRQPFYCAGCPHNVSTRVPDGSRVNAGIGCHYMALWMDRNTHTVTQMGGEGANWIGQAPFTDERHIFVNLGDGTYFHSGLLAIRAAVAAGVNVTYKILFNDAVAMTGGQPVDGALTVQDVAAQVEAEGVATIRVVSDDPSRHARAGFTAIHRDELDRVQRDLREIEGCSVLIYDQTCATELRRKRKRGLAEDPNVSVVINDAVCEGCGDCSVQSSCVAVEPQETEFGMKRTINQTSC
ncbi:MAG: indolepyruvate ferredoxin oxidoreductase family protein, partial [Gammaproteobacteria bacterium]|nr:indolepyruvate ferredoxin oxidoreductase family protein [Gammaproteobacteria bacterium]